MALPTDRRSIKGTEGGADYSLDRISQPGSEFQTSENHKYAGLRLRESRASQDGSLMFKANKVGFNQNSPPDYQSIIKYNIISGVEEEDRLPMIPTTRQSVGDSLVFKQKEIDQIMRKMRQQRELVNGTFVR